MNVGIVVIGSSWGGLHALERLLGALPRGFGAPVVVAQHRQAGAEELLTGLLAARTALEVTEAEDKDVLRAGCVRVAPAGYHLLVDEGHLALSIDEAVRYSRPSIDVLFDSAADVYADRLAAAILTGSNDDGAYGIERVRRRGGLTVAQDPATAERPEMPVAAIATGAVQHVLPLDEIGPFLVEAADGERDAA
jgi:two-component system chemotaxis response regulator CheB